MDLQWLRTQIGHGPLDSDHPVDPSVVRRLACDAGIVPLILGSRSEPLDVGRLAYTVPDGMRRALHVRDRGCTFPGCTRRPRRCHAHHLEHWADGGETELGNLTLLCRYHHQLVHHEHWSIQMIDGRPWFSPRDGSTPTNDHDPADPTRWPTPAEPRDTIWRSRAGGGLCKERWFWPDTPGLGSGGMGTVSDDIRGCGILEE